MPEHAEFGPNEWLVDELHEQYLADKNSVDPAWWEFFADYQPSDTPNGQSSSTRGQEPDAAPAPGRPVETAAPSPAPSTPAPAPAPALPTQNGASPTVPASAPAPTSPAVPAPSTASSTASSTTAAPMPRDMPAAAASRPAQPSEVDVQRLRGGAARTVQNMESSLEIPTATSVRAVPAKLLIDNRIVVNNHLTRSRGGKVSFTHLIGFALVEALAEMPEMNYSYTEEDGRPAVAKPAHINLGIAIDLQKGDGTRQLLVPNIKHSETMDFSQFWAAYEDVVRRTRTNKLGADDFAGTTISLTNPGTIGTVHSVPRL